MTGLRIRVGAGWRLIFISGVGVEVDQFAPPAARTGAGLHNGTLFVDCESGALV